MLVVTLLVPTSHHASSRPACAQSDTRLCGERRGHRAPWWDRWPYSSAPCPRGIETPAQLLCSAVSLWVTNILVFALWYWRLDAGGPNHRDQRVGHPDGAFLFPQMMSQDAQVTSEPQAWSPNFIDYLFLAFNTSTALSPTDVPVLSRWAKLLMMVQAMISLTVIVVLAARAINIL